MKAFQISYIVSPSSCRDKHVNQALNQINFDDQSFFSIFRNGLDVSKGSIRELNLICYDVNVHFDTLFQGHSITTYSGPENAKKAVNKSEAVIIFSNDYQEIETICSEIEDFSLGKEQPLIILASSQENVNLTHKQAIIISCHKIESSEEALSFWQEVRKQLDTALKTEENNIYTCTLQ